MSDCDCNMCAYSKKHPQLKAPRCSRGERSPLAQRAEGCTIDIVITRVVGGTAYARRIRTDDDRRAGRSFPEIRWAELEELDCRPRAGEVIGISERDYEDCEAASC